MLKMAKLIHKRINVAGHFLVPLCIGKWLIGTQVGRVSYYWKNVTCKNCLRFNAKGRK